MRSAAAKLLLLCLLLTLPGCGAPQPKKDIPLSWETRNQIDWPVMGEEPVIPESSPADRLVYPPGYVPEPENTTITFSFAGDVLIAQMLNKYSKGGFMDYAQTQEPSYFLEKVQDWFGTDDFTVVNLENVLSDRAVKPRDKGQATAFWFMAPASYVDILTAGSVEGVSVANNHTRDYGETGFQDTVQTVRDAGIAVGSNDETMYFEKDGFTVAVICNGLWNEGQAGTIASRVRKASEDSDFQIVFFHGGTEGVHEPEAWKVRACRALVDAGADLVLGGHPHVLQPMETYSGAEILYSLGNFCYGGSRYPENRTLIYRLTLTVSPEGELVEQQSEVVPCYVYTGEVNNFQPAPIENEAEKQLVLDFLAGNAKSPK